MGSPDKDLLETHIVGSACHERFLPLAEAAAVPLRALDISMAGISLLTGDYVMSRPQPTWHVLLYTIRGAGKLTSGGETEKLVAGTVVLLPRFTPYRYELDSKEWEILWFHLRPMETWRHLDERPWRLKKARHLQPIREAAEGMLREGVVVEPESQHAATLYAQLLANYLQRESSYSHSSRDWERRELLRALWTQVDASLEQDWSVARMARQMHLSAGHFHRITVQLLGLTPGEKLNQLRMQRARLLLLHSSLPIYQIAEQVGYQNPFAFTHAFRRAFGYPPSEERKN